MAIGQDIGAGLGPPPSARRRHLRYEAIAGVLVMPAVVLMVLTLLLPLAAVVVISLTDYRLGATTLSWVGLDNFVRMAADQTALRAIRNTFLYAAMVLPASVGLGLLIALLVHARTRTRRFYEIVYFLPVTSTMTVMAIVWSFLLHGRIGPVNALLSWLGLPTIGFLSDPDAVLASLALVGVWQLIGFNMILFLAGLTVIPRDLYEAAALDGADAAWERFRRITLPMLGPTMMVVVLLTSIRTFQVFDTVVVLTQGGPAGASDVLLYEIYLESFSYFRVGYGSALTIVYLVIVGGFAVLQVWLADRRVHYT